MKYLSGIFALNYPCVLETCGDWHQSTLDWSKARFQESSASIFGEYGIEFRKPPKPLITYLGSDAVYSANHIRACLDIMDRGPFPLIQGMRKDFICVTIYDQEIFAKAALLSGHPLWDKINMFMTKEYKQKWLHFRKEKSL